MTNLLQKDQQVRSFPVSPVFDRIRKSIVVDLNSNLFPDLKEKYVDVFYDVTDQETTFDDFSQGKSKVQDGVKKWKLLPQNVHKGADRMYDWLVSLFQG